VLSVESVTQVDTSGVQALDVIHSELQAEGIQLLVARPKLFRAFFDNRGAVSNRRTQVTTADAGGRRST